MVSHAAGESFSSKQSRPGAACAFSSFNSHVSSTNIGIKGLCVYSNNRNCVLGETDVDNKESNRISARSSKRSNHRYRLLERTCYFECNSHRSFLKHVPRSLFMEISLFLHHCSLYNWRTERRTFNLILLNWNQDHIKICTHNLGLSTPK